MEDLLITDEVERVDSNLPLLHKSRFEMSETAKNETRLRNSSQIYELQTLPAQSSQSNSFPCRSVQYDRKGDHISSQRLTTLDEDDFFNNQEIESDKYFDNFG